MKLVKEAISKHENLIDGLDGYLVIANEIEDNLTTSPDISIEACKSLIEGLCKKALSLISDNYKEDKKLKKRCDNNLPTLVRLAFSEVYKRDFEKDMHEALSKIVLLHTVDSTSIKRIETIIINKSLSLEKLVDTSVKKISVIRDNQGDISHGRNYPKHEPSSIYLAKSIASITDGVCSYMIEQLARQYMKIVVVLDKLDYHSLEDYNDWLDNNLEHEFPVQKIRYSKVLFDNDYDEYEARYRDEFSPQEEEEKEDDVEAIEKPEQTEKPVERLVNDFDEETFWTEKAKETLGVFSEKQKLKPEELKSIIEDYLFTEKKPLPDAVATAMEEKPKLKERSKIITDLTDGIISLAKQMREEENHSKK